MEYLLLILSVLVGTLSVLWIKPSKTFISMLLAFSGAYLLSVTLMHLLPEVYEHAEHPKHVGLFIVIGVLVQSILESFSKGVDHGHNHIDNTDSNKKKVPWLLFISLCIHAFSEGLPIHSANDNVLMAILVHKLPIAIVLTSFLLETKYSKGIIFGFLFVFSLMSPLGCFIAKHVSWITEHSVIVNSLVVGVLLHVATMILFESDENHKFDFKKFAAVIFGVILTVFTMH